MKHLKLFFALFAMLALGVGNAWGETVKIDFSAQNYANQKAMTEAVNITNGIIVQFAKGGGSTTPAYYTSGTSVRLYAKGTMTVSSTIGTITKITLTYGSSDKTNEITTNCGSFSSPNWTGSATEVVFTVGGTKDHRRIKAVEVTYTPSSGETPGEGGGEEPTPDPEDPTPGTGSSTGWVETAIGNITSSDIVVVTMTNSSATYAMSNDKGTGSAPTAVKVTVNGDKLSEEPADNLKWNITNSSGSLTIYPNGSTSTWLYCTNTNNGARVGTNTNKTFSIDGTYLKHSGTSRYVGVYNSQDWRCYTSSSTNISGQTLKFYKYVEQSSEGGGSTETVVSLTDEQLKWSATTATALKGADNNEFPTLTNALGLTVTYDSSNKDAATIAADGKITLLAPGTTTISAIFAGGEVSGTKYAAKTVTYTLTVKQLVSCADIYNLADDATFVLKDFVVTYVNGKYTYIKDDTGYGLIYKDSYGLIAGDQVASGKFEGKRDSYNGLVEIIPTTAAGDLNATTGTAPEPEPMATNPIAGDMNKYVKFKNVSFASTAFSSKSINGTIEGQGSSIKFYDQFATNKTFDTSKKYDVIGVVSMFNSVQVNFISAEEVAEPTLNVKITNADFGKIAINGKAERTLTLNGSLLTNAVSLAIEGDGAEYFELASNSVTPTDGNITDAKIKITYKPTAEGTHTPTLKITSDELAEQTITLTGQAVQQHTVHFFVNGEEQTDLATKVLSGNTLEELPTATSCDLLNYPTFAGWTTAEIDGTTDVKPTMLDLSTPITSDCNYYAVFEKGTTSSGSTTSAIMKYTGGTTTNMNDGNNAATVGLDETLFNITSTKTASGTHVGLNKANDIRLYANKNDGNGNILTISMLDGSSITKITLDIKQEANFVVKANGKSITGADNVYTIDYPSCSIQNTTTGATTQLHLNSITIEYTTSTTTYEYITSCAAVVPTCEITYDFAGGEGECTNDIVEEGAEYTLCSTAPTKAGHTFLNWKDQNGVEYAVGATITSVTEDLTLTAQWQVNSYSVTWISLGDEVLVNNANYNTQPTKPATAPSYTCGIGSKEFVGWTTQEIDGVGVPANLYTDEFPVVTEAITYYAVFAGRSAEATTTVSTLLVTEKLSNYVSGSMKDDQENVWKYYAGGLQDGETYYIALRNNNGEISYIESPKFSGTVQSIVAHVKNGSASKVRTVYLRSSAIEKPAEGDLGATSIPASNNKEVNLDFTSSFDKFYIQVSEGLQFHKIVVTSGIAAGAHIDYITSCDAVTSSISIDNISLCVGDVHTITATIKPATAASAVSYTIKENATNAISLSGNTITALAEGTATITATIENATDYAGSSIDFKVTVDAAPVTSKVVILAQHGGQWYAMKAEYYEENKSLNAIPVTYINGTLYNVDDAEKAAIEWERTTRGNTATFKKGENYLIGTTDTELKLGDIAFEWAVDGNLYLCDDNKRTFIFNKEGYFKNYSTKNASNGVAIDATYSSLPVVTAPVYATATIYTRDVTADNFGTICLPYGSSNYAGAEFYEVSSLVVGQGLWLDQLAAGDALEAGKPYIFKATANKIVVAYEGSAASSPAAGANGLTGTFTEIEANGVLVGNYIIAENKVWVANDQNTLPANRAYIANTVPTTEQPQLPGRRRVCMGENAATGLDQIVAPEGKAIKVIENGQLIIIRDGVKYNVQGQKL